MDIELIKRLIRLMNRADLLEIEVQEGDKRVKLRRPEPQGSGGAVTFQAAPGMLAAGVAPATPGAAPASAAPDGTIEFRSPMVGTFYRSPSPDAEPFVSKGSVIRQEGVLCIIEAMKVMNEIKSEVEGEIVEVLAKNGEPVEFGQPLFLIKPTR